MAGAGRAVLGVLLGLAIAGPARTAETAPLACGDFLARLHLKPPGVRFVGCVALPEQQGKPLQATYHLSGANAVRAERLLGRSIRMPRLRHSCCQWDMPEYWFHATDGRAYGISMVSDETVAGGRGGWPSVRTFQIVVEFSTEEI